MPSQHRKLCKVISGSTRVYILLYASLFALAFTAHHATATFSDVDDVSSTIPHIPTGKRYLHFVRKLQPNVSAPPTAPFVIRMELWNGNTKTKIRNLQARSNMISLTTAQLSALNIRSYTQAHKSNTLFEGSIQYLLRRYNDDNTKDVIFKSVSSTSPYRLCTSATCDSLFVDTKSTSSTYVLTAIPYSGSAGTGTKWKSTTTTFTLIRLSDTNTPVKSPIKSAPISVPTPIKAPVFAPFAIPTNTVETPLPTDGKWTIIQSEAPITARHESCVAMVNNKMYVIGGRIRAPIDIYDIISKTWTTGPAPPIQLHHMQCVVVDGKIWIVSAWTKSYPNEALVDKTYVFNTIDLVWSTRTALPENRRRGSAASVLVGRRIYVSHGSRGGHATSINSTVETVGWLDYYDIDSDTWTTNLPTAPNPRDHTGGALVKDGTMICVSGGRIGAFVGWPDVPETDCYDLTKGKWNVAADIPVLRSGSSYGTTCDGQLMIAGGEGPRAVFSDVHLFDGTTWTQMPNLSRARHGSGLAVDCSCKSSSKVFLPSGSGGPKGGPLLYSVEAYIVDDGNQSC